MTFGISFNKSVQKRRSREEAGSLEPCLPQQVQSVRHIRQVSVFPMRHIIVWKRHARWPATGGLHGTLAQRFGAKLRKIFGTRDRGGIHSRNSILCNAEGRWPARWRSRPSLVSPCRFCFSRCPLALHTKHPCLCRLL